MCQIEAADFMQTFAFGSPGATVKGPDTPADERERARMSVCYMHAKCD